MLGGVLFCMVRGWGKSATVWVDEPKRRTFRQNAERQRRKKYASKRETAASFDRRRRLVAKTPPAPTARQTTLMKQARAVLLQNNGTLVGTLARRIRQTTFLKRITTRKRTPPVWRKRRTVGVAV